jgi:hypothetical protein
MSRSTPTRKVHNPKSHAPSVYIPCWLIQVPNEELSLQAKIVYGRLSQWANNAGLCKRSAPELAEEMGVASRTIKKYLHELREVGLIGTYQEEAGGKNSFEFYQHEWMDRPLVKALDFYEINFQHIKNEQIAPVDNSEKNTDPVHTRALPPVHTRALPPVHTRAPLNKNINKKEINRATKDVNKSPVPLKTSAAANSASRGSDCFKSQKEKPKNPRAKNLTSIPDDFEPSREGHEFLWKTAERVKMPTHDLLDKFIMKMRQYNAKSNDWQAKLIEFLQREQPKRTFEDANGKLRRYDGGQLHY